MKNFSVILVIAVACLFFTACSYHYHPVTHHGHLPPGQAKKLTGSKSAKPYAPGQQKKKH